MSVEFDGNNEGQVVIHKAGNRTFSEAQSTKLDPFEAARAIAHVKWRTDDLMALRRGAD